MFDTHSDNKALMLLAPAVLSADAESAVIDLAGYEAVEFYVAVGVGGITFTDANKIELVVTESDDNVTFTNVMTNDMLGVGEVTDGIVKAFVEAHAAASVYRFGYKGFSQYLKLTADFSGTHGTGTPISAIAVLRHGRLGPEDDQI